MPANTIDSILAKFVMPVTESGCWIWTGCDDGNGYGAVSFRCKRWLAHRLIYMAFIGNIPEDLELDHLCRVRCCVNPRHLEPVTRAVNVARGDGCQKTVCYKGHSKPPKRHCLWCERERYGWKGGLPSRDRTHCPKGHEYSGVDKLGRRICKTCHREACRRHEVARRERRNALAKSK
jgi:hypothetical protein